MGTRDLNKEYPGIIDDVRRWDCDFKEAIRRRKKDRELLKWLK